MNNFNVNDLTVEQVNDVINNRVKIFHKLEDSSVKARYTKLDQADLVDLDELVNMDDEELIYTSIKDGKIVLLVENY